MCGRYFFDPEREGWEAMGRELHRRYGEKAGQMARGEIFPGSRVAVRANSRRGEAGWFLMRWGFQRSNKGSLLINARLETGEQRPTFAESMNCRRCLIPAQHYFEWEKTPRGKEKYWIGAREMPHMFLAGIYRHEAEGPALVILTRPASEAVSRIHHRMPVILTAREEERWLKPGRLDHAWLGEAMVGNLWAQPV